MALSSLNSHRPAVARDLSLARTLDARTAQMPPLRGPAGERDTRTRDAHSHWPNNSPRSADPRITCRTATPSRVSSASPCPQRRYAACLCNAAQSTEPQRRHPDSEPKRRRAGRTNLADCTERAAPSAVHAARESEHAGVGRRARLPSVISLLTALPPKTRQTLEYSSLPSSFLFSATFRTAFMKSSSMT